MGTDSTINETLSETAISDKKLTAVSVVSNFNMLKPLHILLLLIVPLACSADADDSYRYGGSGSGIRVDVVRHDSGPLSGSASSDWHFRINRTQAILHWVAIPFAHADRPSFRSDAVLSAVVKNTTGPLQISPTAAQDRTALYSGDEEASIHMAAQGTGRATIELNVAIDGQHAAAGKHSTTVVLTVTAP